MVAAETHQDDHDENIRRMARELKARVLACGRPPSLLPIDADAIPPEMRAAARWCVWSWERDEKTHRWTKVPHQANGFKAAANDPATFTTFEAALAKYRDGNAGLAGVGFFLGDGWSGVDVDACRFNGAMTAAGGAILERFPTYAEVSPTGTGFKLFFRADLSAALQKVGRKTGGKNTARDIEVYTSIRFFTITGEAIGSRPVAECQAEGERFVAELFEPCATSETERAPSEVRRPEPTAFTGTPSDAEILRLMFECVKNGAKVRALYDGDISAYKSQSDADLALCCHLAFWLDKDTARMETAFNGSALGARGKWRERPDYRQRTIAKAIEGTKDTYHPRAKPTFGSAFSSVADEGTEPQAPEAETECPGYVEPEEGEQWNDPFRLARLLVDATRTADGHPTIVQWRDEYHAWGAAWRPVPDSDLDARIARHCREVFVADMPARKAAAEAASDEKKKIKPTTIFPVTGKTKGDVRVNLSGLVNHPDSGIDAPFWLWGDDSHRVTEVVAAPNGLFTIGDIAAGRGPFELPTPRLFTFNALPFAVPTEEQPEPTLWMRCLKEWFNGDTPSILGLQEWLGYALSADTSAHKILLLVGPPRSGKGTVLHVLSELVGAYNVASTTFASLGENFGLESLLGKRIAVVPDARLSGRTDLANVVERLLSISGEDPQTVNRKNKPRITTRLKVRFILATNEIPRLPDASGALASRFHVLSLPNSFLGKEDKGLKAKIAAEMPAILAWAARGFVRLRCQGMSFTRNEAADHYQRELEDLSSPIRAFIRERCAVGPDCEVNVADLFESWRNWNEQRNREPGAENLFGRDLRAAKPHVVLTQPRENGVRVRRYRGIGLRPRQDWGEEEAVARVGTRANLTQPLAESLFSQ